MVERREHEGFVSYLDYLNLVLWLLPNLTVSIREICGTQSSPARRAVSERLEVDWIHWRCLVASICDARTYSTGTDVLGYRRARNGC
jgi:hypothetical protein